MNEMSAVDRLLSAEDMRRVRDEIVDRGQTLVLTNGCFDILHFGHVTYLDFARRQGDALVVGVNADASVRRAKGPDRPVNGEVDRARVLLALEAVDFAVIFEEDEPRDLIESVLPQVLVKGSDWAHYVSGGDIVEAHGGRVVLADLVPGRSTTSTIAAIRKAQDGTDVD